LVKVKEDIPGLETLLNWVKFAALGVHDKSSKASSLSMSVTMCNKFPSTNTMKVVYSDMGEFIENEDELRYLFEKVFTPPPMQR
jgi:hypothetical protein